MGLSEQHLLHAHVEPPLSTWPATATRRSMLCLLRAQSLCTRLYSTLPDAPIVLRPYQESCLQACTDALAAGATRVGVSLPTGAGKTTVFISLLSRIRSNSQARQSLVIVNNIELARQTAAQAAKLFPEWSVEIEQGSKHVATGRADMTVATYQTLLQPPRLAKFNPDNLKAVIVDEAHHAAAPSYRRILSRFHSAIKHPDESTQLDTNPNHGRTIPVLGFSATFSRHDGLALGSVFERIVYHRDFLEMIKEQWLCNVRFTTVRANLNLKDVTVSSRSGDFNSTSLAHVVNTDTVNQLVLQTWLDRASSRSSTVIFCVNLAHVRHLTEAFRAAGVDARYIYANTPAAARAELIADFKSMKFPVLLNCAVLTEGTDIPNIDCIVVARPTRSRNLFAQMIGRGMRQSPDTGKADCHVIDLVDSVNRVAGIVSTPSLFGLDPSELVDDVSLEELEKRSEITGTSSHEERPNIPEPSTVTYIDHEDLSSLTQDTSGAPHIRSLSRNAWVGCGDDIYVLECMGKGHLRVEPFKLSEAEKENVNGDESPRYKGVYTPASLPMMTAMILKLSPFRRSERILTAATLSDALKGCDTYVNKVVPSPLHLGVLRSAKWRQTEATENQKAWLRKRLKTSLKLSGQIDPFRAMTKGQAADLITRLKHGALGRTQKKQKANERALALEAKEQRRKAREHVRVGPLPGAT
ncbi:P-loop containing nucleoside triphosphate hydrolase protein [Cristinia sonorae]|uniref:P-loop containing nucleoside triphosphate hydrolase protein n=1 Tax=Cristinia sonorae TaxID=1940300 RepID=A0A8K0XQ54_9AGAR|nr:P-loop containing nucleoside triphosphate hydrolase protein [Cristinia sonorae]